jgi:hypothetical protein
VARNLGNFTKWVLCKEEVGSCYLWTLHTELGNYHFPSWIAAWHAMWFFLETGYRPTSGSLEAYKQRGE